jgi:ribonuclease HI
LIAIFHSAKCKSMSDFEQLSALAFHVEKVASRRLALKLSLSPEQALRQTLESVAGPAGLPQMLAQRENQRVAQAARQTAKRQASLDARNARLAQQQAPLGAWLAWFDGSAHPNPGHCGIGGLLRAPDGREFEISRDAGHGSSSDAEYLALIAVLEQALPMQPALLVVYGDSQVVINDASRVDGLAAPGLQLHRAKARALIAALPQVQLRWIPRHKNAAADALSQRAYNLRPNKFPIEET